MSASGAGEPKADALEKESAGDETKLGPVSACEDVPVSTGSVAPLQTASDNHPPIRALPPEILLTIFFLLQEMQPVEPQWPKGFYLGWMLITHVCSTWRNLAIGCPMLWTDTRHLGLEWVRLVLSRCKTAATSIDLNRERLCGRVGDTVLPHLPRAKTVILWDDWKVLEPLVHKMTHRAPNLEALVLMGSDRAEISFPSDLLGGHAPRLRYLSLEGCSLPSALPIFNGLTRLQLCDTYPASCLSTSTLLDFLATTPLLRTLDLYQASYPHASEHARLRTRAKVALPHLARLEVAGPGADTTALLHTLLLPAACALDLTAAPPAPVRFPALCAPALALAALPAAHTHLAVRSRAALHLVFGAAPAPAHARLRLACPRAHRSVLFVLLQHARAAHLRSLALDAPLRRADWVCVLGSPRLAAVHTLRTTVGALRELGAALAVPVVRLGVCVPVLPALAALAVRDTADEDEDEEEDGEEGEGDGGAWHPGADVEHAIVELARGRREMGVPLARVVFEGSAKLAREFVDAVRAGVGDGVCVEVVVLSRAREDDWC